MVNEVSKGGVAPRKVPDPLELPYIIENSLYLLPRASEKSPGNVEINKAYGADQLTN